MSENKPEASQKSNQRKFIVLDIVFYGSSLNYDQGTANYQELKKITKWDGRQYVLVSRYALRYSILHWANKLYPDEWKLAGKDQFEVEEKGVAHPELKLITEKKILDFPELDLFGFMIAQKRKKGEEKEAAVTRVSPVKIS
ncbi:MAG: type I-B CRISPR-associated protein Cas7/Cst2/DevR, partial [Thermoproteota archaeon]